MKRSASKKSQLLTSAWGALLVLGVGLFLRGTWFGDGWVNASYDYQFCFGTHPVTNQVVLVEMDNAAYDYFHQTRSQPWSREWHARLLNRLADDGCAMVVMDAFFGETHDAPTDEALAAAMHRQKQFVLMAKQIELAHPLAEGVQPILPAQIFLTAARTNWGVAWLDPDLDGIVRRLWPFPSPGPYPSLPWTAATSVGAQLDATPQARWLRYYKKTGAWTVMSYKYALSQPAGFFRNQIVFIGNHPLTTIPDGEPDKFSTPYTRWTGEATGGVDILLTSFLNLVNHDSLLRPAWWIEGFAFSVVGILLGGGLCRLKLKTALLVTAAAAVVIWLFAILLEYYTHYWFPWLVVIGAQIPLALGWAVMVAQRAGQIRGKSADNVLLPETPGYELIQPHFGEGAYGKVWLAKNRRGEWCALKAVYLASFENNQSPYEREYQGIQKYQPISSLHPGLLRVFYVSEKKADYFYYVMELGDSVVEGWQANPDLYLPRDLNQDRSGLPGNRLPLERCVEIGRALCAALDFIHGKGLTHRDIKPPNIIYVKGKPKLADLGLVTDIRLQDGERTLVGTPGFMPPPPERPGTPAADIYSLGIVLYVLSTGRSAAHFPEIATTLISPATTPAMFALNNIILKACEPLPENRFTSAAQMMKELEKMIIATRAVNS